MLADGRIASAADDYTIRFWDPITGAETTRLKGHFVSVAALCLLPDERLGAGCSGGSILLWDVTSGAVTARLEGHSNSVSSLCVLSDGRLASSSDDHTIRLWDIATQREIVRLEVDAPVSCLVALPDGRLVAGDDLGRLHWLEIVD
jgi:WD40 repeat protein